MPEMTISSDRRDAAGPGAAMAQAQPVATASVAWPPAGSGAERAHEQALRRQHEQEMMMSFGKVSERVLRKTEELLEGVKDIRTLGGVATTTKTALAIFRLTHGMDEAPAAGGASPFNFNFANMAIPAAVAGTGTSAARAATTGAAAARGGPEAEADGDTASDDAAEAEESEHEA